MIKQCKICGKEFEKKGNNQIFCSVKCRRKSEDRIKTEKKRAMRQPLPPKPCAFCQNTFVPKSHKIKYCSPGCAYKAMIQRQIARCKNGRRQADIMTLVKCPKCGLTRLEKGRYDRAAREFCKECKLIVDRYAEGF